MRIALIDPVRGPTIPLSQIMPSQPALVISLDLELHWGVQDKRDLSTYAAHLDGVRPAVSALLEQFDRYGIHATWATVGMAMCASREECLQYAPADRPSYAQPRLSAYRLLEDPNWNTECDRSYFAPDLVESIRARLGQEIATHTFSHYCSLEAGQTPKQLKADLLAAQKLASDRGLALESIVFPRNQYDGSVLRTASDCGLKYFRGNPDSVFYRPRKGNDEGQMTRALRLLDAHLGLAGANTTLFRPSIPSDGMLNVPASRFLRAAHTQEATLALRTRRILKEMRLAARTGRCFHLWWHPHNFGVELPKNLAVVDQILGHFSYLRDRYGMRSYTMAELGQATLAVT